MFRLITTKTLGAIAVAATLAGLTVALTSAAPQALAEPLAETVTDQSAKASRLPVRVTGAACSVGAWPYDRACQFDHRHAADEMRPVRIIAHR